MRSVRRDRSGNSQSEAELEWLNAVVGDCITAAIGASHPGLGDSRSACRSRALLPLCAAQALQATVGLRMRNPGWDVSDALGLAKGVPFLNDELGTAVVQQLRLSH